MLEKNEAKPMIHLKRGNAKRNLNAGHGGQNKRKKTRHWTEAEGGGRSQHLDPESVGYYRRVGERLNEKFEDAEEKEMFVENVLSEVKGKAKMVAMDRTGSSTLERLLQLCSPKQVAKLMTELGGESCSDFKTVSCDRCGGHVMENTVRQASRLTDNEDEDQSKDLEVQILSLSQAVRESCPVFIKDIYATHVVRTLLHVLAGCVESPRTESRPGAKDRNASPQLTDFEIPTTFWYELISLTEALIENVKLSITDSCASAVFQTMLTVSHRKRPKLCKKLIKRIMAYLTSCPSAPGVSPLLVFLKDQVASRLIETIIQLSSRSILRDLYKIHLKDCLVDLARHPIANFPIQRLTASLVKTKLFLKLFDEMVQGVEAILAVGHMGVIVQLTESCAESGKRQDELMQCLLAAFHCAEPGSRHVHCLPLFMSLMTYDVYYTSNKADGSVQTEVPLTSVCYHGSRLVQALAKFKDRSILLESLRTLTPEDLLTLACDPFGSHVLQALVTTSSDKGRGKILRRLKGQYVRMACSKLGSRVLEAIWNSASVGHRQSIAEDLVPSENQLKSDQFARHVYYKFALSHFIPRRAQWQEIQSGDFKKRKLFSDILE
ncbi:nucleolar protein 9 [Stigmatopora nigra]